MAYAAAAAGADPVDGQTGDIAESVSCLAFSPTPGNFLVAGTWDNSVMCWQVAVQQPPQQKPVSMMRHDGPVLSVAWSPDGSHVFSGACDNTVRMWRPDQEKGQQIGAHDKPVKAVRVITSPSQMVVSGSWDRTLRYWDARSPSPVGTVPLSERVYCMDTRENMLAVGCADNFVYVFDTRNPATLVQKIKSKCAHVMRCISIFPDLAGFALGSVEGRVAVHYLREGATKDKQSFSFKCHRNTSGSVVDAFPVNDIAFSRAHHTFVTVGSDGKYCIWDKAKRERVRFQTVSQQPLSACALNHDETLLAYAVSYDWSQGPPPVPMRSFIGLHNTRAAGADDFAHARK